MATQETKEPTVTPQDAAIPAPPAQQPKQQETKTEEPVDTRDALELIEQEAKEWEKVCSGLCFAGQGTSRCSLTTKLSGC